MKKNREGSVIQLPCLPNESEQIKIQCGCMISKTQFFIQEQQEFFKNFKADETNLKKLKKPLKVPYLKST